MLLLLLQLYYIIPHSGVERVVRLLGVSATPALRSWQTPPGSLTTSSSPLCGIVFIPWFFLKIFRPFLTFLEPNLMDFYNKNKELTVNGICTKVKGISFITHQSLCINTPWFTCSCRQIFSPKINNFKVFSPDFNGLHFTSSQCWFLPKVSASKSE